MAAMAEKHLEEPYSLSSVPLVFEGGTWQDWMPPEGHHLHRTFKQMVLKWIGPLYDEQGKLLNAVHEKLGIDIFVASFSALQNQEGELLTYRVCANGADSLLPVAQKVAFMMSEGISAVFADFRALGDAVNVVHGWPTGGKA